MMQTQQISLFSLNSMTKSNFLLGNQFEPGIDKRESFKPELVSPFFFQGLTVYIDLLDESQKKTAECVLGITGAQIIAGFEQKGKIFDADVIVTDKVEFRNHLLLSQKASNIHAQSRNDAILGFRNPKRQISTANKKNSSIIISPDQIPWAFITTPLQDNVKMEPSNFPNGINQSWINDALPQLPPPPTSRISIQSKVQQTNSTNLIQSCLPNEQKSKRSRIKDSKNKISNIQNSGFHIHTQKLSEIHGNNPILPSSTACANSHFTGGLIVVADSTMRSAPNFCYLNQTPEIRLKPLPEGIQFISPFVSDENITKLCKERTESLLANANISNNINLSIDKKTKKKDSRKKNTCKDGSRSNAAACRYCGICKKTVTDEEKHRSSLEHKQNVSKQFIQVDELVECFSNFPYI